MRSFPGLAVLATAILVGCAARVAAGGERLRDLAGLLSPGERTELEDLLARDADRVPMLVVTVPWIGAELPRLSRPGTGSYASYTFTGEQLQIKEKYAKRLTSGGRRSANRVLLMVAPEHPVEGTRLVNPLGVLLEIDAALEKDLPAEKVAGLLRETLVPAFSSRRFAAGLRAAIEGLYRSLAIPSVPVPSPATNRTDPESSGSSAIPLRTGPMAGLVVAALVAIFLWLGRGGEDEPGV